MSLDAKSTAQSTIRPDRGQTCHERTPAQVTTVLAAFCFALPLIAIVASLGVVPLLLTAAPLAVLAVWRSGKRLPKPDGGLVIVLGSLLAWCAVSSLWSFDPAGSLTLTLRIGAIFGAGLAINTVVRTLDNEARRRAGRWLVVGVLIGLAVMATEFAFDFPLFRTIKPQSAETGDLMVGLNRGATAMAMLCWPAAAIVWRRKATRAAVALPLVTGVVLGFLASLAAIVGVAAGAATVVLATTYRKAGRVLLVLASIGAFAGGLIAAKQLYASGWHEAGWLPTSAAHRVVIWNFTVDRIMERPLTGWGFDSARAMSHLPVAKEMGQKWPVGLHPHNAPLQVLLELGAVGGLLALALLWLLIDRLERLPQAERVTGQALFISTLAISCTAYGIWQNQWLALIVSVAALLPLSVPRQSGESTPADRNLTR